MRLHVRDDREHQHEAFFPLELVVVNELRIDGPVARQIGLRRTRIAELERHPARARQNVDAPAFGHDPAVPLRIFLLG